MALEPNERIIIPDEDGEEHLFETLLTFDVDETNQSYVAVVPVEQSNEEEEEVEVYAFRYEMQGEDENELVLFPIESDDEWDQVEEMLQILAEEEKLN